MSEKEKSRCLDTSDENTIFHKILRGEIPSTKVYEDEDVFAFRDIHPQAPVHIIVIPKQMNGLNMLSSATEEHIPILGKLLYACSVIAKMEKLDNGYRTVINCGREGCQSVNYIHVHLLGGRQLGWPPC